MNLKEFIGSRDVDFTKNLVSIDEIENFEDRIGVSFGGELIKYIVTYGYLAYKYIEMYGVNSKQMFDSDMVKQTEYLHQYFPKTRMFIALENCGDGKYALVSPEDEVFEYVAEENRMKDTGLKLFDYIYARFREAD